MIYSCLENKTDAKYEVLIFEHFHSPRYREDERERGKRNISHKWRRPFLTTSNSPEYFLMRGGWGSEHTRECDIVIVYMCLSPRPVPRVLSLGEQPKLGSGPWRRILDTGRVSRRIWFLRRRLLVRHLLQQSWMYWCVTLSLEEGGGQGVTLAPAKLHQPGLIVWSHRLLRLRNKSSVSGREKLWQKIVAK